VSKFIVTIVEKESEWIVAASVDGNTPFVESFSSKRAAWLGAKQHADGAEPGDTITVRWGDRSADGLSPDAFVAWLRDHWSFP
jgi:hypothetical protein